jgi:hypothetical protein
MKQEMSVSAEVVDDIFCVVTPCGLVGDTSVSDKQRYSPQRLHQHDKFYVRFIK